MKTGGPMTMVQLASAANQHPANAQMQGSVRLRDSPISTFPLLISRSSNPRSGRFAKDEIFLWIMLNACWNEAYRSVLHLITTSGSVTHQCALAGRPFQIGNCSRNAAPQTVKAKLKQIASGEANSHQLFGRRYDVSCPFAFNSSAAIRWMFSSGVVLAEAQKSVAKFAVKDRFCENRSNRITSTSKYGQNPL